MAYEHSTSIPPVPSLSGVPYLCKPVGKEANGGPRAPGAISDADLNRTTADPQLPPFGGSASLLMDLVTGPGMINDRVTSTQLVMDRYKSAGAVIRKQT
jgi:hypothetical protein